MSATTVRGKSAALHGVSNVFVRLLSPALKNMARPHQRSVFQVNGGLRRVDGAALAQQLVAALGHAARGIQRVAGRRQVVPEDVPCAGKAERQWAFGTHTSSGSRTHASKLGAGFVILPGALTHKSKARVEMANDWYWK